jgi:hypothetical protein
LLLTQRDTRLKTTIPAKKIIPALTEARRTTRGQNKGGKPTRSLLSENSEQCFSIFKMRDETLISAIVSKRILTVLQRANKLRNDWQGHVGVVNKQEAQSRHETLLGLVQEVRSVFGSIWEDHPTVIPGRCVTKSGCFLYDTKRAMGTRTPFATLNVELAEPMEDGHLHICSADSGSALKLLPLIKVMPSSHVFFSHTTGITTGVLLPPSTSISFIRCARTYRPQLPLTPAKTE